MNNTAQEYVRVAEVASLRDGSGRTVHAKGREFAVFNKDGKFYAVDNRCPHRGGPLGAGSLEAGKIYCPLHGWGFDLQTGACLSNPDFPVRSYPTRVVDGEIEILF